MARKNLPTVGDLVRCPDYSGVVQDGIIQDDLSVMYYVQLDDGRGVFVFKADRNLTRVEE